MKYSELLRGRSIAVEDLALSECRSPSSAAVHIPMTL